MGIKRIVARQKQKNELAYYKHLFAEVKPFIQAQQRLEEAYRKGYDAGMAAAKETPVGNITKPTLAETAAFGKEPHD